VLVDRGPSADADASAKSTRAASTLRSTIVVGASRCTAPLGTTPAPPKRSITRHWADGGTDEAAAEGLERVEQSSEEPRFHPDVVVEEEHGRCRRPVEEELPLLGEPAPLRSVHEVDPVPLGSEHPHHGLHTRFGRARERLGLVAHDHVERRLVLGREAGERHRELTRAADRGDEYVDPRGRGRRLRGPVTRPSSRRSGSAAALGHDTGSSRRERMRSTIDVVECDGT
jgi:hypothetical protein